MVKVYGELVYNIHVYMLNTSVDHISLIKHIRQILSSKLTWPGGRIPKYCQHIYTNIYHVYIM